MQTRITALVLMSALTGVGQLAMAQNPARWIPPSEPVYVVTPASVEGSGASSTKFGDLLMLQIYPEVPVARGEERPDGPSVYSKGKQVALYIDGQHRGDVTIAKAKEYSCNSAAALVVPTLAGVSTKTTALATNAPGIQSRPGSRRVATASERSMGVQLAAQELQRNGVPAAIVSGIQVTSLVAIDVAGVPQKTLAGSFFIQTKLERHDIFLIARISESTLSLEYSRYGKTTDLADFKDRDTITLIDHLDLDHDGNDEIVLRVRGYESELYEIYSYARGRWQLVSTGGGSGC